MQHQSNHKKNIKTYAVLCEVEGSTKNFIREKVVYTFLKELKDGIKGYLVVTTLNLLTYAKERWGEIHAIDITNIQDKMMYIFDTT